MCILRYKLFHQIISIQWHQFQFTLIFDFFNSNSWVLPSIPIQFIIDPNPAGRPVQRTSMKLATMTTRDHTVTHRENAPKGQD